MNVQLFVSPSLFTLVLFICGYVYKVGYFCCCLQDLSCGKHRPATVGRIENSTKRNNNKKTLE